MAFIRKSVALTTVDADIYVCPAGVEASAHGVTYSNITASAITITIKFFNASTSTTITLASISAAANKAYSLPKAVNMNPGDKIIASASANSSATILISVYENTQPTAVGFTLTGTWSSGSTYATNDVVYFSGNSYAAIQASTNQTPVTATSFWQPFALQGNTGPQGPKALSISNPTSSENVTLFFATQALTISNIMAVVTGTTPNVSYSIASGTNRSSATTTHVANVFVTSTSTGTAPSISSAAIAANTWVWLTTAATSGTVTSLGVSMNFSV